MLVGFRRTHHQPPGHIGHGLADQGTPSHQVNIRDPKRRQLTEPQTRVSHHQYGTPVRTTLVGEHMYLLMAHKPLLNRCRLW